MIRSLAVRTLHVFLAILYRMRRRETSETTRRFFDSFSAIVNLQFSEGFALSGWVQGAFAMNNASPGFGVGVGRGRA